MPRDLLEDIESQPRDLLEDTETITPEIVETKPTSNLGGVLTGLGLGGGAVAGAGYGIKKGYEKFYKEPRIAYRNIENELLSMQKGLGLEGTGLEFIPQKLSEQAGQIKEQGRRMFFDLDTEIQLKTLSLESAKTGIKETTQSLKNQLDFFDTNIISKSVEDLGTSIKTQYPQFFSNASENYGKGLQIIENHFEKLGANIDTLSFDKNLLDKTIKQARFKGVSEEEIAPLIKLQQFLTPKVKGAGKILQAERTIPFSQAKTYISNTLNENPFGGASKLLRDNWGEFLEEVSSGDIKDELKVLNSHYKTFKNAQAQLMRLSSPRTGEFNIEGLNKWTLNYVKNRRNNGILDLMEYISEGSPIVEPMKGIKSKWSNLGKLLEEKFKLGSDIQKLEESGTEISKQIAATKMGTVQNKAIIEQTIREKIDRINALTSKYDELADKLKITGKKVYFKGKNIKNLLKNLGTRAGFKAVSGGLFGITGALALGSLDPTNLILQSYFGTTDIQDIITNKRGKELRKLLEKSSRTPEEEQELLRVGLII